MQGPANETAAGQVALDTRMLVAADEKDLVCGGSRAQCNDVGLDEDHSRVHQGTGRSVEGQF